MDPIDFRLKLTMAVLLGTTWTMLVLLPVLIADKPGPIPASFWIIFGALPLYFFYTGVRAWRRGWKSRFILRIVIPLALLAVSSILQWTGIWARVLA